ncbi:MAG: response regulator transcription factor [Liquorilactobacillus nagelii]|jgi:DNA-binding response OmpR family regulator|nr:response regulator transcription factor [Liquorilactobacillus nagelii]KRL42401.1 winged helix family two component transcriptional regulator [Liquorilactobacillus nagelii DSM 13675]MCI1699930.1 response regulator transcription factor [Liquorilactobacillus nagelii]MCP9315713.1 response regulator transcription factor [Liquorilactobacillus nagelii]QYH53254.1 response regulator transcription factor [Liquorilactobacillus nagelii DSM 13675]ULQ50233.1 response regulator transcription factor [Liquo
MNKTVLLVEDEPGLVASLKKELQFENYQVLTATDGLAALTAFNKNRHLIDLIILDWMLPKLDGLGVLRRIRRDYDVPIIMLTARDYTGDKVAGLTGGADDYVTKPFDIEELLARITAVLRRPRQTLASYQIYQLDDLTLDTQKRRISRGKHNIQLTQREYNLLTEMFKVTGKVFTRNELLDLVWGSEFEGDPNIVDVYIRYLRNKIDKFPECKKLIHTIRGVGYSLTDD